VIGELVVKKRISADELVWIFHERMQETMGNERLVTLAIVPDPRVGWRVVLTRFTQDHRPETVAHIRKLELALRDEYALFRD
jgi:hypothetical protein